MGYRFHDLMFTPLVRARQARQGAHDTRVLREPGAPAQPDPLGRAEAAFIAERDSFYMATVSETGWPYVQHRGGPPGFLKVLDAGRIAFPDFRGNRQYVSLGNLDSDARVCLFLIDYPARRRLKLLGRARIVEARDDERLMALLRLPSYVAAVERGIEVSVEAFDWNCSQHITPRFTVAQVEQSLAGLNDRIRALEAERDALSRQLAALGGSVPTPC